jgi:hypothetical protein
MKNIGKSITGVTDDECSGTLEMLLGLDDDSCSPTTSLIIRDRLRQK